MRRLAWLLLSVSLASAAFWGGGPFGPKLAKACGGVFSGRLKKDERKPSLSYEQTLIVHDPELGREHFVREVVFRAASQPFGFVVPTPARPEVAKLAKNPFERLRAAFPYRSPLGVGHGLGQGFGSGAGPKGGGVRVLEVKKVGSFTAFVLAADDEAALSSWLAKHRLESGPETRAWLAHYVRAKYFFVAMRYDPVPSDDGEVGKTQSETVRFSFDTPLPYYPYFEPERPDSGEPRLLELWLVTPRPAIPVALRESGGTASFVRPFAEGFRYEAPRRSDLEEALGADKKLLFAARPIIQRFMDQKRSRAGFGDVVFVPGQKVALDARALGPLLSALDPSLAGAKEAP